MHGRTQELTSRATPLRVQAQTLTPGNYADFGLGQHSYCRNPDRRPEGVWCFTGTTGADREACSVPLCVLQVGFDASLRRAPAKRGSRHVRPPPCMHACAAPL